MFPSLGSPTGSLCNLFCSVTYAVEKGEHSLVSSNKLPTFSPLNVQWNLLCVRRKGICRECSLAAKVVCATDERVLTASFNGSFCNVHFALSRLAVLAAC